MKIRIQTAFVLLILLLGISAPLYGQTTSLAVGEKMPDLSYTAFDVVKGGDSVLSQVMGTSGSVIIFWSNQCPWVTRYQDRVNRLQAELGRLGMKVVFINANDAAAYPKEGREISGVEAGKNNFASYLMDESGELAMALGASRTPQVFVFDSEQTLVYSGMIDDSPGDPGNVNNQYVNEVISAMRAGGDTIPPSTKAFGCRIKM